MVCVCVRVCARVLVCVNDNDDYIIIIIVSGHLEQTSLKLKESHNNVEKLQGKLSLS